MAENINILPLLSTITGVDAAQLEADLFVKEGDVVMPIEGFEGKVKEIYTANLSKKLEDYAAQKVSTAKAEWEQGVPVAAVKYLKEQAKALNIDITDDEDLDTVKQKVLEGYANDFVNKNGYKKGGEPKTVTEDDIKRHEFFVKTVSKIKGETNTQLNAMKAELEKTKSEYTDFVSRVETEKLHTHIASDFRNVISGMKPVVADGKQPQFEKIVKVAFSELVSEYDFGTEGEGTNAKIVVYEKGSAKTGKPIPAKDAAYNPLNFKDLVMTKFREFHSDFYQESKQGQGSGTGSGAGAGAGAGSGGTGTPNEAIIRIFGKMPTTVNEALDMLNDTKGNVDTRKALRRILDDLRTRA